MLATGIESVEAELLDIPLSEPFGIAGGAQVSAQNVLVRVRLLDGSVGLGEAAPFPAVNGETQAQAHAAALKAAEHLRAQDARRWRRLAADLKELIVDSPSARAALECALLDAVCRRAGYSLWHFFGGKEPELVTDITIPTGTPDHASESAQRASAQGFTTLKVKVGGAPLAYDVARLRAIVRAAPDVRLLLDANASLTSAEAIELIRSMDRDKARVVLFEQPTAAPDLSGLYDVRKATGIAVAADESAQSARDVARLALAGACDVVNIKIMKTGVVEALEMVATARAHGLDLMIGGMVESKLAMSVSACLAGGLGGFRFVDLDTPLFMPDSPLIGGYARTGARLRVDAIAGGHGVGVR
jgi:o-succinylbenzoate synthase